MPYDDNSFGGLGGAGQYAQNLSTSPLFLAGLQMLGNNSPRIGAIPNSFEGVPTVLMSATDRQRKAAELARQIQQDAADKASQQNALTEALVAGGTPRDEAQKYAPSLPAIQLYQDAQERKRRDAEFKKYNEGDGTSPTPNSAQPQPALAPAAVNPYAPKPVQTVPYNGAMQQQGVTPEQAQQQALATASSKFDAFGQANVNKTVAEAASYAGNQTIAAKFIDAARQLGLSPNDKITGQVLSNPAMAKPLAQALGIGADLPDDQWTQAHAEAFQASKARQAAVAAQQQAQSVQQPGMQPMPYVQSPGAPQPGMQPRPYVQGGGAPQPTMRQLPFTQTGPSPAVQPQQQVPAQVAPQQQAPEQNVTERAVALREQNRVAELQAKIAREEKYLGSSDPRVSKVAAERILSYRKELDQKPQFTTLYKDSMGREVKGFVHPDGTVTPYNPPKDQNAEAEAEAFPGDTVDERLKSVPAQDRAVVKAMLDGRSAPPTGQALRSERVQYLINLANRADPLFDQANWKTRVTEAGAISSGGRTGRQLISINTLVNHAGHLDDAIDKLNNTKYEWLNPVLQAGKSATGDTQFQKARGDFESYRKLVSDELVNLVRGGVGAQADVADWNKKISMAKSPEELHQVVDSVMGAMLGRAQPLVDRHNQAFGTDRPVEEFLSPEARKTLQDMQERRMKSSDESAAPAQHRRTGRYPGSTSPTPGNYTYDPQTRQMVPQQ